MAADLQDYEMTLLWQPKINCGSHSLQSDVALASKYNLRYCL